MKRLFLLLTIIGLSFVFSACHDGFDAVLLERNDWAPDVYVGVNDFMKKYAHQEDAYVVFDFDNTSAIFDIEEQLMVYQLQTMSFAVDPIGLRKCISTGLEDQPDIFAHWITDIVSAYTQLYEDYGPFTADGLSEDQLKVVQADPMWREFATKMARLYLRVGTYAGTDCSYCWVLTWFTGMTEKQVYDLAYRSHTKYAALPTTAQSWIGPTDIQSLVGPVDYQWTSGIQVTENIKELWHAMKKNGIDVWVCSASGMQQVLAAIDAFGMHNDCAGVMAMTMQLDEDGRYLPDYDYNGAACVPQGRGGWLRDNRSTQALTGGPGKVTAICNVLLPKYGGKGPLAGFMDSSGDFNFCTEFSSLKMVVCFNRGDRKVTDGGGLVAEVAIYERDYLGWDLSDANAEGETLYLLQGRDENGMRTFRASNATLRYGIPMEHLFANEDNYTQLEFMEDHDMTIGEIFNRFAIRRETSSLGFPYGFLNYYAGYHSR